MVHLDRGFSGEFMEHQAILTILGMAGVTYFTRAGGLWLMNRITITPKIEASLKALPGCILISIVAPLILAGGPAEAAASLLVILVALRSKNLLLAMSIGVAAVWGFRHFLLN